MRNNQELVPAPNNRGGSRLPSPALAPSTITVRSLPRGGDIDWEQILRILQRSWRITFAFALGVFVIVTIVSFRLKDIYEPKAQLEIDPPGSEVFSLKDLLNSQASDQDYIETQAQILNSDELAVAVIRTLGLDRNPEIVGNGALLEARDLGNEKSPSATQLTRLENIALRSFKKHLTVTPIRNSRLVEVKFASQDPRKAAQVTNTLVNLFIDRNYRTRYETTMQASEWLQSQLSDLREKVEKSQEALVKYQRSNNIVDVDDKQNTVTQKVAELNRQLTQAQADRIQLQADLKMVEAGAADSLSQIRNNQLLQNLAQRLVDSKAQLAQALAIYGKNNSNVKKLQGQADEINAQLNAERQRVVDGLKTSYAAARAREGLMAEALDEMKGLVSSMNQKMIQYNVLKNEAKTNSELYDALLGRLKEAGISAGLKSSNIRVVDQARVLDKPTGPNRMMMIAVGLFLGILGGVGVAFLVEYLDNTIRTPDEVKAIVGLPSLAMLPFATSTNGKGGGLRIRAKAAKALSTGSDHPQGDSLGPLFLKRPKSQEAEAVRTFYTSLMLSRAGQPPRVIMIVSPSAGDGKTTVVLNLATALAEHAETCIVDVDLRRPMVEKYLGLPRANGLSHVLTGLAELESVLQTIPDYPNLKILPVGPLPPNPGELVASEQMKTVLRSLREKFQYIVLDTPPVIPFADARALSPFVDGVVIVGRFGATTRQAIIRSNEILCEVDAPILGVVLNCVDMKSADYYYYNYGYSYGYRQGYGYKYSRYLDRTGTENEDK